MRSISKFTDSENFITFTKFINSNFFITLIIGGLMAWLSFSWQNQADERDDLRERAIHRWEYKRDTLIYFSEKFVASVTNTCEFKLREIWLKTHANDPVTGGSALFDDGTGYEDTKKSFEAYRSAYLENPFDALFIRVRSSFDTEAIMDNTGVLSGLTDRLILATSKEDVKETKREIQRFYNEVIELMALEIKDYYVEDGKR